MIIRTAQCGEDPRVAKFIFHYQALGIKVGITCFTRGKICSRKSSSSVLHSTYRVTPFKIVDRFPRRVRKFILAFDFILNSIRLAGQWNPKVIHGCDVDGYTLARIANGFGRKKIFEVYDPWTTMTQSKLAAVAEGKAFYESDVLVMSAKDSRIKIPRIQGTFLGNEVDIELAESKIKLASDIRANNPSYFLKPYILVGGTLNESIRISNLIEVVKRFPSINMLIASKKEKITEIYLDRIPDNIVFIGEQDWGTWLSFVKYSSFVWVYYDVKNFHYESHISPNKYWEASLYNRPMFVYEKNQFCDRVNFEGKLIELGEEIELTLPSYLESYLNSTEMQKPILTDEHHAKWLEIQNMRRHNVKEILQWVELL